jgi:PAS domain S-box-containing protein
MTRRTYPNANLRAAVRMHKSLFDTESPSGDSRANEQRYRRLIESLPAAVFACDTEMRITMFNESVAALWGRTPRIGDPLSAGPYRTYSPDGKLLSQNEFPMARVLSEGRAFDEQELVIERPDGTRRNVLSNPQPLRDASGTLIGAINMLVDITERKQAEEARRRSEEMLRLATDAAGIGIWTRDLTTDIVRWSPQLERVFGAAPGEFAGTEDEFFAFVHPDDRKQIALHVERAIAQSRDFEFEFRFRARGSGDWRWMVSRGRAIADALGRPVLLVGTGEDVTERKRAADELAATRDQLAVQVAALTRLSELSRRLAVTHDVTPALQAILQTLVDLHGGQHGLFALYDNDSRCLSIGASVGFDEAALEPIKRIVPGPETGATGTAFATRQRVVVEDIETDTRFDSLRRNARAAGFRAVHSTPVLTRDGAILGVLSVYFSAPRVPTQHEMNLADMCALHAADALEGARDEQALRESEQRFRTMADHAPVMIWVRDADGACTFLSRSWYEFTGQTPERSLGSGWLDAIDPIDRAFVQRIYQSAAERHEPLRIEYRLRARNRDYRWVIDTAAPRFDNDGTFHGYVGSLIDITERKRTEVALQESESRFRRMADSAPVLIWVSDTDKRWTWFNQPWLDFVGRSMADELGNGWTENVHPADVERCVRTYTDAFDRRESFSMEFRLRRYDGEYRRLLDQGVPLYDGAGEFAGYIGSCFDVTEERRQEQALRAARNQLRMVTDTMAALVTRCSRDLRFVWTNKAYARWRNLPIDEIEGHTIEEVVGSETFARLQPYIHRVLAGETVEFEMQVSVPQRGSPWLYASYVPTYEDGPERPDGWVSVVIDITQRKELEEALKDADRRKDEFLASLAHELRNPLAPMQNALQIMSLRRGDAEEVERARTMLQRQMRQMVRLVDDLLDVNRVSRGKIQLRKQPIDVAAAVLSAIETSRPLIDDFGHALTVTMPPQPIAVEADLTRLAQVFANLLNNAAKYTERNGELAVRVTRDGDTAIVEIEDNGAGIAAEKLASVFEMFTQLDAGPEHAHGGLGIGLTIAKRLIDLHGGMIEAASDGPGHGSVFTVRLPALPSAEGVETAAVAYAEAAAAASAQQRVLIAEDHKDSAASLARLLEILGNSVCIARDGEEAVAIAEQFRPRVILLDIGMPKLNGYEACKRIREKPWSRDVVIVALTGWGQEADRRRSREAGFDHHLVKPVELDALEAVLSAQRSA